MVLFLQTEMERNAIIPKKTLKKQQQNNGYNYLPTYIN